MHYLYWIAVVLAITLGNTQAAALPDDDEAASAAENDAFRYAAYTSMISCRSHAADAQRAEQEEKEVDSNKKEAIRLATLRQNALEIAAAGWGDPQSLITLAAKLRDTDPVQAVKWLLRGANQGDEFAKEVLLGNFTYRYVEGALANKACFRKALAWLTQEAEQGNVQAQRQLASWHKEGRYGLEPDLGQAISWLEKGTESDDTYSQRDLGLIYESDTAPGRRAQNLERAFTLLSQFVRSVEHTPILELCALARIHESKGSEQDLQQAFNLYNQARDPYSVLDPRAMRGMARLYESGHGVEQDVAQALVFFHLGGASEDAMRLADIVFNPAITPLHAAESAFLPHVLSWALIRPSIEQLQPFFNSIPTRNAGMRTCLAGTPLLNGMHEIVISFIGFEKFTDSYCQKLFSPSQLFSSSYTPEQIVILCNFLKANLPKQETQAD